MGNKDFILSFKTPLHKLTLTGIGDPLSILYNADIDFTDLVERLSFALDETDMIKLTCNDDQDKFTNKEKIIYDTLNKIIDSYNVSFQTDPGVSHNTVGEESGDIEEDPDTF